MNFINPESDFESMTVRKKNPAEDTFPSTESVHQRCRIKPESTIHVSIFMHALIKSLQLLHRTKATVLITLFRQNSEKAFGLLNDRILKI